MGSRMIVGLGNVGSEYLDTRHNIGFIVIDGFVESIGAIFREYKYAYVADVSIGGNIAYILKPTTYMNNSGQAISYWQKFYKIRVDDILVVVDDLHLTFGRVRYKTSGSSGGHNGLKSIEQCLKTDEYPRLRFGIGDDYEFGEQSQYVLQRFSENELKEIHDIQQSLNNVIHSFISYDGDVRKKQILDILSKTHHARINR